MLFLWRQELSCQSQFGSFHKDLERSWFVPGRSRAHCIYYWFVSRHDLALHFVCSPLLSQWPFLVHPILKPTRTASIPGPDLPYLSGSWDWWHLFHSYAFSLLFSCRFFLYIQMPNLTLMQLSFPSVFQCNSWRSCEKCDALLTPLLPARQPCDCSSGSEWVPMPLGASQ